MKNFKCVYITNIVKNDVVPFLERSYHLSNHTYVLTKHLPSSNV